MPIPHISAKSNPPPDITCIIARLLQNGTATAVYVTPCLGRSWEEIIQEAIDIKAIQQPGLIVCTFIRNDNKHCFDCVYTIEAMTDADDSPLDFRYGIHLDPPRVDVTHWPPKDRTIPCT